MTDLATQVAGLTTSVNALTSAVNVAKATLDASVSAAGTSATTAQAAVTTAASSAAAAQSAQAAAVAVSGLSSLNSFLGQIQAGAPAAVFWYDTTRDSDGGAWRRRCTWQSWVTEATSSTRGSRSSFPAQALIVVQGSVMTIYDADQATPAMWMMINLGVGLKGWGTITSVTARDGKIIRSANTGTDGDTYCLDFIRDDQWGIHSGYQYRPNNPRLIDRNTAATSAAIIGPAIGGSMCNSVAVTVVPGAPIDRATGLPKSTVVVAHTNGISVIHASGQIANVSASGGYFLCSILEGQRLAAILANNSGVVDYGPIPYVSMSRSAWMQYYVGTPSSGGAIQRPESIGMTGVIDGALRNPGAMWRYHEDPINPAAGMLAMITASGGPYAGGGAFNSGWMVGDCRLVLSTTSTASMTGTNIASWTSSAGTTGWTTTDGNLTLSISGSDLQIAETASTSTASKAIYQVSGCVVGQVYLLAINLRRGTVATIMRVDVTDNAQSTQLAGGLTNSTAASTVLVQFRATDTSPKVRISFDSPYTSGQTGLVTSLSVDLAEPDRSAIAVGMRAVGALTKSLVASTADLAAWSGFSASAYLEQPYNTALDFGAGDFMVAAWVNPGGGNETYITRCAAAAYDAGSWGLSKNAGNLVFDVFGIMTLTMASVPVGVWGLAIAGRRAGTWELWWNGTRVATSTTGGTTSMTAAAHVLRIGLGATLTTPLINAIAQIRLGATAPTPEQIARMYADERPLFQPGAKCVLGGTSAAVQGLAHDPDTGALYAAKGDGTSVFQGLVRTAHLTGLATAGNSDNHTAVAARQGGYVIATANQAVASQPAIVFRDRILADRVPVAPIDANRVVFPPAVTTDATPTVIARLPVAEGDELQLFVDVEASEYGAAPTERMGYQRRARVYRLPNGNVTVVAVQTLGTDYESNTTTSDITVVADATSQTVCVQATGVTAKRLVWATLVHINRAGSTRYAA
ncbi:hypothetical protein UAJ10_22890 [Nitrospirillum sp. BR 11164]|uniref:hypothetical protein n=1 Tax=Nitrospirillum sp. BR 11164 TaxID=3104324 RepID=UPI002AFFEB83|nr:hypothetical protein [Nitrospirillum sp. BR 11164]MEA1651848.1 hypothetical protein [Nitrospirillum sp. BR 11164]